MPNRLASAASPYLRQHADNPVDWYPWGEEALARARAEDRPILLSIGYAACHWCHVMAHECFSDPEIAARMNASFVNVKVDREERPDLDAVYQTICQLTGRAGGWPLTVFLTPALRPFFVGTYFPPQPRHGLPAFPQILDALAEAWATRRDQVERVAAEWTAALAEADALAAGTPAPAPAGAPARAAERLAASCDRRHGGFGQAPKFPNPEALELLLRVGGEGRRLALFTLRQMARGGIYDQLGGGFHRYSVDAAWRVPHFEKMLYDNALLPPLYLAAYQLTGEGAYARVARETCDFLLRELRAPAGGFCASLDADSEGEEGRYYLWTAAEVRAAVGEPDASLLIAYYGVGDPAAAVDGRSVLHVTGETEPQGLAAARARMWQARERRVRPGRDDKVLAGWNGLAVSALAQAGRVLDVPAYTEAAVATAGWLRDHLGRGQDGLLRVATGIPGFLQDYAYVGHGLVDLYTATLDGRWLRWALALAEGAVRRFYADGVFYQTEAGAADLIHRPRDAYDTGTPSGEATMAHLLLRLEPWGADAAPARAVLDRRLAGATAQPFGQASLLNAAHLAETGPTEVTLVGQTPADWLRRLAERYLPNLVLARVDPDWPGEPPPLWRGKAGGPGAYVCQGFTCSLLLTSWEEIAAALPAG